MKRLTTTLLCWTILLGTVWAHKPSDSYLTFRKSSTHISAQWDIALRDLHYVLDLDTDHDGQITWRELQTHRDAITAYAMSRLQVAVDHQDCTLEVSDFLVSNHSDGAYAALMFDVAEGGSAESLELSYSLLFDEDPTHRGLVHVDTGEATTTRVLAPDSRTLNLRFDSFSLWDTFRDYVREGVWHIWIGFDHILFLLALLLPAVLVKVGADWKPIEGIKPALSEVLKIVTVFTVAHSLTLWLAVMEYVTLPSWIVEAAIALSIIITAYNNLHRVIPLPNWAIAFAFGLVHGFGFANVLLDLGLSSTALAVSLLGFNVGVELGQLAIVAAFLPIGYAMRNTSFYLRVVFQVGSAAVALIAGVWLYERCFNAEILGI